MYPDLAMLYAMYIMKYPERYTLEGAPAMIRDEIKAILDDAVKKEEDAK